MLRMNFSLPFGTYLAHPIPLLPSGGNGTAYTCTSVHGAPFMFRFSVFSCIFSFHCCSIVHCLHGCRGFYKLICHGNWYTRQRRYPCMLASKHLIVPGCISCAVHAQGTAVSKAAWLSLSCNCPPRPHFTFHLPCRAWRRTSGSPPLAKGLMV
jgi:hypothetical protein